MTTEAKAKPDYLGLLNAIALGERNAGIYLKAWAKVTPDEDLKKAITTVARRESSHGKVFKRRLRELGYDVMEREDPGFQERFDCLSSTTLTDVEKIQALQARDGADGGADLFKPIEEDMARGRFDPLTESMLRWYIGEERDSVKVLRAAYDCVKEKAGIPTSSAALSADAKAIMDCMTQGFTRLEQAVCGLAESMSSAKAHENSMTGA